MPLFTRLVARRLGPVGIVLTAYDIWRRIPPKQRKRIAAEARKHLPTVARAVAREVRRSRERRKR